MRRHSSPLRSTSEAEAVAAARKLVEIKTPTVQAALYDALALGVPPKVAAAALTAWRRSAPPNRYRCWNFTLHRNPDLRKRATQGLAALVVAPDRNRCDPRPPVAGKSR